MAGWHHRLNGHKFEQTPGVGDGQGGLVCCDSWGRKESDTTERLNWTEQKQKILRRGGKNTQKNYTKKDLNEPDNYDGMITHLELDILQCKVKWALGSITTNKACRGDGIPVKLFQILKDDAMKVLHSICQQTQQWPQDWKRSIFIPIPKNVQTTTQLHSTPRLAK